MLVEIKLLDLFTSRDLVYTSNLLADDLGLKEELICSLSRRSL